MEKSKMSEEKKMIVELKPEDRDLLKSVISKIDSASKEETDQPSGDPQASNESKHATLDELLNCPDCYPKVRKAVIEREFKDADHECTECGLPVKGEVSEAADWECVGCGSKYARRK